MYESVQNQTQHFSWQSRGFLFSEVYNTCFGDFEYLKFKNGMT